MIAIIKREINGFFASTIGYLVIAIFLVINGLFLWVFAGPYNILDAGFAELTAFFELAPWVLLFLIPAVTMKSFSEEIRSGTLEILLTKPISLQDIVMGKFLGAVLMIVLAIIPTFLYIITISELGNPPGNWDAGSTLGSYLGLFFLVLAYSAIGVFASSLSKNQIVSFIIAVFLCFFLYYGLDAVAAMIPGIDIRGLGMKSHFDSVSRGVLDTRDAIYFISIMLLFVALTIFKIGKKT